MEIKEIRLKSKKELLNLVGELRKKLDELKWKVAQKQLKNLAEIKATKHDLARILMTLKEKENEK